MKSVKITRDVQISMNNKMFNGQDLVAGTTMKFEDHVADSLINRNIAEAVEEEKTVEEKVVEKEAPKKAKAKSKAKPKTKAKKS